MNKKEKTFEERFADYRPPKENIKIKIGDAVTFEYRDKYDREDGTGIVIRIEGENHYRVVLIDREDGEYLFTNYETSLPRNRLKPQNRTVADYGLEISASKEE